MRRFVVTALALCFVTLSFAQTDSTVHTTPPKKNIPAGQGRSNDHFMIQMGYLSWTKKPDSINTNGFPRTFNMYVMLDFPFKTDPHWSVAIGPGIASDNMYFEKTYVGIKDKTSTLQFHDLSDTSHFKKYKLATAYLEAPIELRYRTNPGDDRRSVKFALGAKIGTLLSAHVKGKDYQDKNDNTILDYIQKEKNKDFFNKNRFSLSARAGYGHFTFFANYSITPLFKEGLGPNIRPLSFGLTLSGL